MTQYNVGETKRLQATFRNAAGSLSDPTTIQLRIGVQEADGTVRELETYTLAATEITRASIGVFYRDYTFPEAGTFVIEFTTTGAPTTVVIGLVDVATPFVWV